MKKEYIRPESKLFAINLAENIADASAGGDVSGTTGALGIDIGYTLHPDGTGYFHTEHYSFDSNLFGGDIMAALYYVKDTHEDWHVMLRDCMIW